MLRRGGRLARCGDCTQCRSPSCMHPTRGHSNFELKRLARVVMGILVLAVSTVSTVSAVSAAAAAFQRHAAGSAAAHPTPAAPVAVVALCVATRRASGHTPPLCALYRWPPRRRYKLEQMCPRRRCRWEQMAAGAALADG